MGVVIVIVYIVLFGLLADSLDDLIFLFRGVLLLEKFGRLAITQELNRGQIVAHQEHVEAQEPDD